MGHDIECGLGFHNYKSGKFNDFAEGVLTGMEENSTIFDQATAPVTTLILAALIATMLSDFSKYKKGGLAQKQTYLTSKGFVMDALNKLIPWVNGIAKGNAKIIILAGYEATYSLPAHKPGEEDAPVKITVKNGQTTGSFTAECETFGLNRSYGCIVSEGKELDTNMTISGLGQIKFPAGSTNVIYHDLNHSRSKKFMDLTPGVKYWFYFYVISTTGVTSLSQAVVKMCV